MIGRTGYRLAVWLLKRRGYPACLAPRVWQWLRDDFLGNSDATLKQKLWAYRRGFLSQRIRHYGLTSENFKSYLSDLAYWKLHPINGTYSKWIDDKLTMRYILNGYAEYLPKYYFELQNGRVLPLVDCPEHAMAKHSLNTILDLLATCTCLALKPCAGSGGEGFCKLELCGDRLLLNNAEVSEEQLLDFLQGLHEYLVTEVVVAHAEVRKIYPYTANTVRLLVINDQDHGPNIVWASIKFGVKETGILDNVVAGALFCPVTLTNGEFTTAKKYVDGKLVDVERHPDTGVPLQGCLPNWALVKEKIVEIGCRYPQLKLVGYDIILTDPAFRIVEMNSLPELGQMQRFFPVMQNQFLREFFASVVHR